MKKDTKPMHPFFQLGYFHFLASLVVVVVYLIFILRRYPYSFQDINEGMESRDIVAYTINRNIAVYIHPILEQNCTAIRGETHIVEVYLRNLILPRYRPAVVNDFIMRFDRYDFSNSFVAGGRNHSVEISGMREGLDLEINVISRRLDADIIVLYAFASLLPVGYALMGFIRFRKSRKQKRM